MTLPIHPGEYFRDELDARGWTTAEFADGDPLMHCCADLLLACEESPLNHAAKRGRIGPEFAAFIAARFGQDAETWLKIDQQYQDVMRTMRN